MYYDKKYWFENNFTNQTKSGSQKSFEFKIDELVMCCACVVSLLRNLTNGNSKLQVLSIFILSYDIK